MVVRGPAAFFLQFRLGQQLASRIRIRPRSALFHKDREVVVGLVGVVVAVVEVSVMG
jgi:hypothetical protein